MYKLLVLKAKIPPSPSFCSSHVKMHLLRNDTLPKNGNVWAITQVCWSLVRKKPIGWIKVTWQTGTL